MTNNKLLAYGIGIVVFLSIILFAENSSTPTETICSTYSIDGGYSCMQTFVYPPPGGTSSICYVNACPPAQPPVVHPGQYICSTSAKKTCP